MAHTLDHCEHDGIRWFPRVTVEKYSPDQSAYAERRLLDELSWGRRLLTARLGVRVPRLHGDWLREVFGAPEEGYARAEGNSLVNGGLDALTALLTGTGGQALSSTGPKTIIGVGTGASATTASMTALQSDNTANAFYQATDTGYPSVDGTVHGQLDGQATFISTSANFSWTEWCWASATVSVSTSTGTQLSAVTAGTEVMFNRWTGTSLGTKGAGATWVFSTTITFS